MATLRPSNEAPDDEHTPLLNGSSGSANNGYTGPETANGGSLEDPIHNKTFNKTQVMLLSFCRMVDPIAFFTIVPFINQMIFELTSFDEADIGFYSGLIESLFSVVQMVVMVPYGRLADRIGRKPILIWSYAGLCVTATLFGFSTSLWQMIVLRCAAGLFSGSVVAVRAMITENSTPTTQARAFSIFGFFGNIGIFLGTLIGGLAHPAKNYEAIFGNVQFLKDHPFALPTMIAGIMVLIAFFVALFAINETIDAKAQAESGEQWSTWDVLKCEGVPIVLFIWCWCSLLGFAYTAVAPVFWFTSVGLGGFGFRENIISAFLALGGISQALWMLLVFPYLQPRISTGGVLKACAYFWPFLFALHPIANLVLRAHKDALFWTLAPITVVFGSGCSMAFIASQLAVNEISPSHTALGTINGIALAANSATRAFTPALFTSIFAIGVGKHILKGQLIWIIMIACTLVLGAVLQWLPAKINTKPKDQVEDEAEEST